MYIKKDQKWAFASVVGAFVSFGLAVAIDLSFSILYKDVKIYFDISNTTAASISGLILALRFLLSPLVVVLIRCFECDKVCIFGGLILALGLFIASCSQNLVLFIIGYAILVGIGVSCCYTATLIVLSENFSKRKSLAFGLSSSGVSCASIIFPHIFALAVTEYEFRSALMLLSAFALNMIPIGLLFKRPKHLYISNNNMDLKESLLKINKLSSKPTNSEVVKIIKESCFSTEPFKNSKFLFVLTWNFLCTMGLVPWSTFIVDFIRTIGNVPLNISVLTFTLDGIAQFFARTLSGLIFDNNSVRQYRGIVCAIFSFTCGLASFLLVMVQPSIYSYLSISVLRGICMGVIVSQHIVILGDICDPIYLSMSIGIMTAMKGIGGITGSSLAGLIRDNFPSYFETYIFLAFSQFSSGIILLIPFVWMFVKK